MRGGCCRGAGSTGIRRATHLWVHPEGRDAAAICVEAERAGVVVSPGAAFVAPGEPAPNAFRVALGAEPERARMVSGLEILGRVLAG